MTTTVGSSTSYALTIPELSETADIQTAIKLIAYGQSTDPTNNADIESNSLAGYLISKAGISAPTFTGTVSIAGQNSQYPTSLAMAEATHATSRRTSIQLGLGWQIGQDSAGDGTKNFYIYQTSTQLNPFTISSTNNISIGATGYTTTFVGNVTIPTIVSNTINATGATTTGASLYPNITTGTIAIGSGLTTGTLNIATAAAGAKTINIGTSTGAVNFNSAINTAGITRTGGNSITISTANSSGNGSDISINGGTSSGNGGNIIITAGNSGTFAGGNVTIDAGNGGASDGDIYIGTTSGTNQFLYLGTSSSQTYIPGGLEIGGGAGIGASGVTISSTGNIDADGALTVGGGYQNSGVTISSLGAISLDSTLTAGSNIVTDGKTNSVTEEVAGFFLGSSGQVQATRGTGTPLYVHRYGSITGAQDMIQFVYKGTLSGTIRTTSAGTPTFAAPSDYRVKTNIAPITDAIERMKNAKAYTFYKIIDPTQTLQTGFIAHELAEVQSDLVVGEKDAVDENGAPIYQEVMETKLIPVMAQAINDLIGMVEKLTAEVEQLKTK